jgi:chemotaxis signal transduction protein
MQKLVLFKVSDTVFAVDQKYVKKTYQKEAFFGERIAKAKKVKVKLDGQDVPLYDLPVLFGESGHQTKEQNTEAMLVKDEEGHMVLLADQIEGVIEVEEDHIVELSPVFGKRSCLYFPTVFKKDDSAVLILSLSGIRMDAASDNGQQTELN